MHILYAKKNNSKTIPPKITSKQILFEHLLHVRQRHSCHLELAFSRGKKAVNVGIREVPGVYCGDKCRGQNTRQSL